MENTPTPTRDQSSHIILARERYEAAWRAELDPRIEEYLAEATEAERPELLRELLAMEIEWHRCRGEKLTLRDYLERFPEHTEVVGSVFESLGLPLLPAGESGSLGAVLPSTIDGGAAPFGPAGSLDPTLELDRGMEVASASLTAPFESMDEDRGVVTAAAEPTSPPCPRRISRYAVIRLLGRGGFGHVYLARDEELDRLVAIKVPCPGMFPSARQVDEFLAEARSAACLRHPSIVTVHDIGRQEDGSVFVVLEYIDGRTLSDLLRNDRPPLKRLVELLVQVSFAVHHAHRRGLVHRDLKPANILVDHEGQAHVTDFGLAINESTQRLRAGEIAGTPTYMAPEQVRGETHRLDGRTDIWGLGVIFYQVLTKRHPFVGNRNEIFDQILNREPKPPRQIDDTIPAELERICLKCLMSRMTERHNTAADLAEDLQHWLDREAAEASVHPAASVAAESFPVPVIPKGLRAFDSGDAEFFLELLPGPRDRDGLPEILRFWKSRIEEIDPEKAFSVGLIYGPSGSGKSSLVKAGLLPRLHRGIRPLFIEATPNETESRLLGALRRGFPELPATLDLTGSLAALRDGTEVARDHKVLLILDQFEQWLYAHPEGHDSELVQAFRQCDGRRVQCVILVRDDFWMAITRFMRDLEVPVREGWNSAAVELFDPIHARKVLERFGAAFGRLPARTEELSLVQERFLDLAVAGLKRPDGRIIPVRLSLFAEMIRGRPWVPATIKDVGGAEGIGVAFLEETFSATSAPPMHRYHQQAARSLLRALLPGEDAAIKGRMRSTRALREAAGYVDRPADFADLLRILDTELRLVTPTDREGKGPSETETGPEATGNAPGETCYQLTHDDLVPSIRDWLTRKQRETRRGRAEIRLAERSDLWRSRPEPRLLPSFLEWLHIRWFTRSADWTEPERRLMKAAARRHLRNAVGVVGVAALLAMIGFSLRARVLEERQSRDAEAMVERLLVAEYGEVPKILHQIRLYRDRLGPRLKRMADHSPRDSKARLLANLALLDGDPARAEFLGERMLTAGPAELTILRDALWPFRGRLAPLCWEQVRDEGTGWQPRIRAACALAHFDPGSPSWAGAASGVVMALVREDRLLLSRWMDMLRPVRQQIVPALRALYLNTQPSGERSIAASVLADYLSDDPSQLCELILDADAESYRILFARLYAHRERAILRLEGELTRELEPRWNDPPIDDWPELDRSWIARVEAAEGLIAGRFAFCQTLPMADFDEVAEALRNAGYCPTAFRPYHAGDRTLVAAVWTRDGRDWRIMRDRTPSEIHDADADFRKQGFLPADLAYYPVDSPEPGDEADDSGLYAALWYEAGREGDGPGAPDLLDVRMYVGVPEHKHKQSWRPLLNAGFAPRSGFMVAHDDGSLSYSSIRWKLRDRPRANDCWSEEGWSRVESKVDRRRDLALLPVDVRFSYPSGQDEVTYATVWWAGCGDEAKESHGLPPREHLRRCQTLAAAGFRPTAISARADPARGDSAPAIITASVWRRPIVAESERDALARRQANAAVALLQLEHPGPLWSSLRHRDDPRLRSTLIDRLASLEVEPRILFDRLHVEPDVSVRRALILALGGLDPGKTAPSLQDEMAAFLWSLHHDEADPGIHSATELTLRRWGHGEELARRREELRGRPVPEGQHWFVDRAGHTLAILPGPMSFTMGSPGFERPRDHHLELLHPRRIDRTIAVATEEVTVAQFLEFDPQHLYDAKYSVSRDCPVNQVTWFDAARYCNHLSARAKIPRDQWCYPEPIGPGMSLPADVTSKLGYRLPTEAEWEYFCRAGARTSRPFGHSDALLSQYAWTVANSQDRAWPVGRLLPNDLGMFDVLGNVWEWCHERFTADPRSGPRAEASIEDESDRSMRGGSFLYVPSTARSAHRDMTRAGRLVPYVGFRVVRTLPQDLSTIDGQTSD